MAAGGRPSPWRWAGDVRLVPAVAAAWLGAVLALRGEATHATAAGLIAAGAAAVLVLLALLSPGEDRRPWAVLPVQGIVPLAALALVLLSAGGSLARAEYGPVADAAEGKIPLVALLRVSGEPVAVGPGSFGGGDRFMVEAVVTGGMLRGRTFAARTPVVVFGPELWGTLGTGDTVRASGTVAPPDRIGRAVAVFVPAGAPVIGKAGGWLAHTADLRRDVRDLSLRDDRDGGLLPGMALGDRTGMDPALADAMRTTGLTHLTAVSGANCSYVVGFAYLGLRGLRLPRFPAAVGAVVALLGFVLLVRPEPSVLRAALMGTIGIVAVLSGRGRVSLTLLLVSIIVLLAADPWLCVSFAFILSVLATFGLITTGPTVVAVLTPIMPRLMAQVLAIPLTAQLFCLPVLVLLQPALPLYSLPANVLASPAVPGITLLGMLAVLALVAAPALAHPLILAAQWGTRWVAGVAETFAAAPVASLPWVPGIGGTALAAVGSALVLLVIMRGTHSRGHRRRARDGPAGRSRNAHQSPDADRSRGRTPPAWTPPARTPITPGPHPPDGRWPRRHGGPPSRAVVVTILVLVLAVGAVLVVRTAAPVEERWVMALCDVGQGDGIVVRTTAGHALVVDVGPDPDAMDRCLDRLGIGVIDALVISHLHEDHYGGIAGAVRGRTVDALYYSTGEDGLPRAVTEAALDAGVDATRLTEASDLDLPPLDVEVLHAGGHDAGAEENDSSAVLRVLVPAPGRSLGVLLMGDLEERATDVLLREHPALTEGSVDVLKIAHHGARNGGTAIIDAVRPHLALISAGRDNDYGHPHPETLAALAADGIAVARTDDLGSFRVDVVGTRLEVRAAGRVSGRRPARGGRGAARHAADEEPRDPAPTARPDGSGARL